jgi:hypothetical protein
MRKRKAIISLVCVLLIGAAVAVMAPRSGSRLNFLIGYVCFTR